MDSKVLDGLRLTQNQRRFIIKFCNPESSYYNDKHGSYIDAGYTASNKKALIANVAKLLGKEKIKEGIRRYQKEMINSKKLEISSETITMLRKRATYDVSTFYNDDGTVKPLSNIPHEWHCCIDEVQRTLKGATASGVELKYSLCHRDKAMSALTSLLQIQKALDDQANSSSVSNAMNMQVAVDSGKDKDGNQGPRIVFNISQME